MESTSTITPSLILVAKSPEARRRATCAMMDAGGRYGFHWQVRPVYDGAIFTAFAPCAHKDEIHTVLADWFRGKSPYMALGEHWLVNAWNQPLSREQMDNMNAWRSAQLRAGRELFL